MSVGAERLEGCDGRQQHLQMRVVAQPSAAPNLASTINQGAFNPGSAVGAWLGGPQSRSGFAELDTLRIEARI